MPSDPAERRFAAGHPRLWVAGFVLCALVVALLALRQPERAVVPTGAGGEPSSASTPLGASSSARAAAGADLVDRLARRLRHGTRPATVALAAPGDRDAVAELGALYDNVQRLSITGLSMRYVDEAAPQLDTADQRRLGSKGWVAAVELRWRLARYDHSQGDLEIHLGLTRTPSGARFVTARGDYSTATPLWLLSRVYVRHGPFALVLTSEKKRLDSSYRRAERAVADVRRVLPDWRGNLVLEASASQGQLDRVLGAEPSTYAAIAAVTTTVDGSASSDAPVRVFVNPAVFDRLGPRGSQVVISHEATHVALGAATSTMPLWLLEGFADYVALAHVDLPVATTASQILAQVARQGPPVRLPGSADFDSANPRLGAVYESAWLACRLLAREYGEAALIRFYREADRDSSVDRAFATLGTTERAFTRSWRASLRALA